MVMGLLQVPALCPLPFSLTRALSRSDLNVPILLSSCPPPLPPFPDVLKGQSGCFLRHSLATRYYEPCRGNVSGFALVGMPAST